MSNYFDYLLIFTHGAGGNKHTPLSDLIDLIVQRAIGLHSSVMHQKLQSSAAQQQQQQRLLNDWLSKYDLYPRDQRVAGTSSVPVCVQ